MLPMIKICRLGARKEKGMRGVTESSPLVREGRTIKMDYTNRLPFCLTVSVLILIAFWTLSFNVFYQWFYTKFEKAATMEKQWVAAPFPLIHTSPQS